MAGSTSDPFRPPDEPESGIELAQQGPPPPRPAATLAEPRPRAPVRHRKPPGGASNLLLWTFALIGVAAVASAGVWGWRRHVAKPAPKEHAPIQWRSLPTGDDVLVTFELAPKSAPGARLLLNGDPLASNPILLPRGSTHELAVMADGFQPKVLTVTADAVKTVRIGLDRAARGR